MVYNRGKKILQHPILLLFKINWQCLFKIDGKLTVVMNQAYLGYEPVLFAIKAAGTSLIYFQYLYF